MPETNGPSSAELCDLLLATGEPRVWEEMHAALVAIARRHGLIENTTADNADSVKLEPTPPPDCPNCGATLSWGFAREAQPRHLCRSCGHVWLPGEPTSDPAPTFTPITKGATEFMFERMNEPGHYDDDPDFTVNDDDEPADSVKLEDTSDQDARSAGIALMHAAEASDFLLSDIWAGNGPPNLQAIFRGLSNKAAEFVAYLAYSDGTNDWRSKAGLPPATDDVPEPDPAAAEPAVVVITDDAEVTVHATDDVDVFVYPCEETAEDLRRGADMLDERGLIEAARDVRRLAAGEP